MLAVIFYIIYFFIKSIGNLLFQGVQKIADITSNMDSVVIVAVITGGISIVTVIISSVISKLIEYKQITKRYLYEKREKLYSEFIEMVYKLQLSNKNGNGEYTQ